MEAGHIGEDSDMAKICVTGGLGFVGSHLAERLSQHHAVKVLDDGKPSYGSNLPSLRSDWVSQTAEVYNVSIGTVSDGDLKEILHDSDLVVHLASWPGVRDSMKHAPRVFLNNVSSAVQIMSICSDLSVPLILASSSSVYGDRGRYSQCSEEDANGADLRSPYAYSKWIMELWAKSVSVTLPPTLVVRPFSLYGPWGRPDMAYFAFAQRILERKPVQVFGSLATMRDFTYIDDATFYLERLCEGMILEPEKVVSHFLLDSGLSVANICNGSPHSLERVLNILTSLLEDEFQIAWESESSLDLQGTYGDPTRTQRYCGVSETPLEQGLANFASWIREYHSRLRLSV